MSRSPILMGVVGRPHGVRGLLHIHAYAADPASLARLPLFDDAGRRWTLAWRGEGVAALTDAAGQVVADRTAAAALTNMRLYVERELLPAPEEDEFYLADLVGLQAEAPDGVALGRIVTVHDYGAGPSLEIAGERAPLLVPFTRDFVPTVDVAAGRVVVVPPAETELRP